MARVLASKKRHELCEVIGQKRYQICYRNTTEEEIYECWIDELNADLVNVKNSSFVEYIRSGLKLKSIVKDNA